MQRWDTVFQQQGLYFTEPHRDIQTLVELLRERGGKKVLDVGCGSGRHLVYLAEQGLDVYGLDESKTAQKLAAEWLSSKKLTAHFDIGNLYDALPYADYSFDAVISTQALHHGTSVQVHGVIAEIERVLKPQGLLFVTVPKRYTAKEIAERDTPMPKSEEIEPNVFVPLEGKEKGLPHMVFTESSVREYFHNFIPIKLTLWDGYHCLVVMKND